MKDGRRAALASFAGALICVACGGSCPQAADATAAQKESESAASASTAAPSDEESASPPAHEDTAPESTSSSKSESAQGADPEFPQGASVDQATAAVPKGTARANIDPDRLAEPLQQDSVYEPCKVGSQHFKVRVAVWGGHAVGVDVTTPNKKLAECIDKQVRSIAWPDKVRSLNTVEYSL